MVSEVFHYSRAPFVGWSYGPLGFFMEVAGYEAYEIIGLSNTYLLNFFMKLIPIVFDFLIFYIFVLFYTSSVKQEKPSNNSNILLILVLTLLNPVAIYYSSIIGMQESAMMFLAFFGIFLLYFKRNKISGLLSLFLSSLIKFVTFPLIIFAGFYGLVKRVGKVKLLLIVLFSCCIILLITFSAFVELEFLKRAFELALGEPSWISFPGILRSMGLPYDWVPFVFYPIFISFPFILVLTKKVDLKPLFALTYFIIVLTLFISHFQLNFLYWSVMCIVALLILERNEDNGKNFPMKTALLAGFLYFSIIPTVVENCFNGATFPAVFYTNLLDFIGIQFNSQPNIGFGYGATILLILESLLLFFILKLLDNEKIGTLVRRLRESMSLSKSILISSSYILLITFALPFLFSQLSPEGIFTFDKLVYILFLILFPLISFFSIIAISTTLKTISFRKPSFSRVFKQTMVLKSIGIVLMVTIIVPSVYMPIAIFYSQAMSTNREINIERLELTGNDYYTLIDLNIATPNIIELEFTLTTTSKGVHIKLFDQNTGQSKYVQWGSWGWCDEISNRRFRFQIMNDFFNVSTITFYGEFPQTGNANTVYENVMIKIYENTSPEITTLAYWQLRGLSRNDMKLTYYVDSLEEDAAVFNIPESILPSLEEQRYPVILGLLGELSYPTEKNEIALILKVNSVTFEKSFYQVYDSRSVEWQGKLRSFHYIYLPPNLLEQTNVITVDFQNENVTLQPFLIAIILFEGVKHASFSAMS